MVVWQVRGHYVDYQTTLRLSATTRVRVAAEVGGGVRHPAESAVGADPLLIAHPTSRVGGVENPPVFSPVCFQNLRGEGIQSDGDH